MILEFSAIGIMLSPYKEKFAIPRQPGLVDEAKAKLKLSEQFTSLDCVRGLGAFSHIWLEFVFHQTREQGWKPTVRPPRLGGNQRVGVFASRSTFRPNGIGLSVVRYLGAELINGRVYIKVAGADLLDQTPILDIKPYLAYADIIDGAQSGYAQISPETRLDVEYAEQALIQLAQYSAEVEAKYELDLKRFIEQVLAQDPRPAYKQRKSDNKVYGVKLCDLEIRWQVEQKTNTLMILSITAE